MGAQITAGDVLRAKKALLDARPTSGYTIVRNSGLWRRVKRELFGGVVPEWIIEVFRDGDTAKGAEE